MGLIIEAIAGAIIIAAFPISGLMLVAYGWTGNRELWVDDDPDNERSW